MSIKENLLEIKDKISKAEEKAGREPGSVKLMAVSKLHSLEEVQEAVNCGQLLFGENRVQEAEKKFSALYEQNPNKKIELHIIGQLQTNKVKNAVKIASCIESVDRYSLLEEIEKQCTKIDKVINILFEIHTGEESKSGFTSEEELLKALSACEAGVFPHICPKGFMTMAPFIEDEKLIRQSFTTLRELAQKLQKCFNKLDLSELSMGMSGDFELAIEEGSTLVRIGTSIFGQRDYTNK